MDLVNNIATLVGCFLVGLSLGLLFGMVLNLNRRLVKVEDALAEELNRRESSLWN